MNNIGGLNAQQSIGIFDQVAQSFDKKGKIPFTKAAHKYIAFDAKANQLYASNNKKDALSFEDMMNVVSVILANNKVSNSTKLKLIDKFETITKKFERKNKSIIAFLSSIVGLGGGKERYHDNKSLSAIARNFIKSQRLDIAENKTLKTMNKKVLPELKEKLKGKLAKDIGQEKKIVGLKKQQQTGVELYKQKSGQAIENKKLEEKYGGNYKQIHTLIAAKEEFINSLNTPPLKAIMEKKKIDTSKITNFSDCEKVFEIMVKGFQSGQGVKVKQLIKDFKPKETSLPQFNEAWKKLEKGMKDGLKLDLEPQKPEDIHSKEVVKKLDNIINIE